MNRFPAVLLVVASSPCAALITAAPAPFKRPEVERLVAQLRQPANRLHQWAITIPGGECIDFSPPMKQLIRLGAPARAALHRLVDDRQIQNEVVLVLGAVGDKETVGLLIDRYPRSLDPADPNQTKMVCFSFALSYLTGECIDRTREGTTFNQDNARRWRDWWGTARPNFRVPAKKPRGSWVPHYPRPPLKK
jgi:hypothetical protein